MNRHAEKAQQFLKEEPKAEWFDQAVWAARKNRDRHAHGVLEWEDLRTLASQIKENALSRLDEYLLQFEEKARRNGVQVHWAGNAEEHNQIVLGILQEEGVQTVVKSKSMLTEECRLNPFLEKHGLEIIDTDLGERIVQLKGDPPSHIVGPALHLKKEEVGELFHEKLGSKKGASDPKYLTEAARRHLRAKFLRAQAAITGVNFAIAETGAVVVCTNEGNADMGVHLAPLQIHCMGIEKILPKSEHLGVFNRLLARSCSGQPITIFTSHYLQPRPGTKMHVVLVDNGRTDQLGRERFRASLKCIRCGACLNTCPVYRRSGGHSYEFVLSGPIGAILAPGKDMKEHADLPFASSLCGSCSDVCPVKINIHEQLYAWRQEIGRQGHLPPLKKLVMKKGGDALANPKTYQFYGGIMRRALRYLPRPIVYNWLNTWGRDRELPAPAKESFREWYRKNRMNQ